MTDESVSHIFIHMVHKITQEVSEPAAFCLIGINERGMVLAKRMSELVEKREHILMPVYTPSTCGMAKEKNALLMTDAVHTGVAALSAVHAVLHEKEFSLVLLGTVADVYNQRRVPLQPSFVGKRIYAPENKRVCVGLREWAEPEVFGQKQTKL